MFFRKRWAHGRDAAGQPFPMTKSLRGVTKPQPSVKTPQQRPHDFKPFALEQECQPGTRGFVRSTTVHYDRATFWDFCNALVNLAGRDVDRAWNPQTLLLIGKFGAQIYNH